MENTRTDNERFDAVMREAIAGIGTSYIRRPAESVSLQTVLFDFPVQGTLGYAQFAGSVLAFGTVPLECLADHLDFVLFQGERFFFFFFFGFRMLLIIAQIDHFFRRDRWARVRIREGILRFGTRQGGWGLRHEIFEKIVWPIVFQQRSDEPF